MGIVIDLILLLIIGIIVVYYSKKGIMASSKNLVSLILTVVLLACLQTVILEKLWDSAVGEIVETKVTEKVEKAYSDKGLPMSDGDNSQTAEEICKTMSLPMFLSGAISDKLDVVNEAKNNILAAISGAITELILRVLALILLYVVVRVSVFLIINNIHFLKFTCFLTFL